MDVPYEYLSQFSSIIFSVTFINQGGMVMGEIRSTKDIIILNNNRG